MRKERGKSKFMVKVTVKNSEKFFIPEMTHSDKSTLNYRPFITLPECLIIITSTHF